MPQSREQKLQPINQVWLAGMVRRVSILRYTPAGIPIAEGVLEYREVVEPQRTVVLNLPILFHGEWALMARSLENQWVSIEGRLVNARRSVVVECCHIKEVNHGIYSGT